jgi:putative spermidine/putrescine transport system ATP-binding protein
MAIHAANFRELRIDRLSRAFGALAALKEVNLTIRQGEFIALLGPSGCGKSTTLNILAGLLPSTGGGIWLDERRIDRLRPEERGFGMVFQNYALFPHMSVRKNIGFGLMMRGVPKAEAERRIDEAVALVRLKGQEHKLPGQLSGGQQQRVAIARAIVVEPPLVLMDEPLSNLDAKLRLEMRAEIRRIHNTLGATTIYVTHDQEEALSLADRIVVLKDGVVRQVGKPDDLFARPDYLDVAEFMGFRNRLQGRVVSRDGGFATVSVAGDAQVTGRVREDLKPGDPAIFAVRAEDLEQTDSTGGLAATVVSSEFRGREFVAFGDAADGSELTFRAHEPLQPNATPHLRADPERALVFRGDAA